jgi:hypothetical protein
MKKSKMTTVQFARAIRVALQKRKNADITLINSAGQIERKKVAA